LIEALKECKPKEDPTKLLLNILQKINQTTTQNLQKVRDLVVSDPVAELLLHYLDSHIQILNDVMSLL